MRKNVFSKMGALALILSAALLMPSCGNVDNPLEEIASGGSGSGSGGSSSSTSKTAATIKYASATLERGTADPAFTYDLANSGDGAVVYESSDPTIAEVNATTGEVTPKAVGTVTIKATVSDSESYTYTIKTASYDLTLASGISFINQAGNKELLPEGNFTTINDGGTIALSGIKYIVKGTVTINGDVSVYTYPGEGSPSLTEILLCDGAELIVTGKISGQYLNIYAQSNGANMGKLTVTSSDANAIDISTGSLYFCGGKITATSTKAGGHGIYASALYVNGGEVKAQGGAGGHGVQYLGGCIYLNNGKLEAIGGDNAGGTGGHGVNSTGGAPVHIQNNNAVLIARGGSGATGGNGVDVSISTSRLNYLLGQFTAIGGAGTTTNGKGVNGLLVNESGAAVTFQASTDGTDWPEDMYFSLAHSTTSTPTALGVRKVD